MANSSVLFHNKKRQALNACRFFGAGEGNRTLISSLGSWCSATELHPHIK